MVAATPKKAAPERHNGMTMTKVVNQNIALRREIDRLERDKEESWSWAREADGRMRALDDALAAQIQTLIALRRLLRMDSPLTKLQRIQDAPGEEVPF